MNSKTLILLFAWLAAAAPSFSQVSVVAPGSIVAGKTLEEWSAEFWKWAYSMSTSTNPLFDAKGHLAHNGQEGPVFYLGSVFNESGTPIRRITVRDDQYLFFPLINVEWNNIGIEPPWTEAELRDLAIRTASIIDSPYTIVNGVGLTNFFAHRLISPEFSFNLPETDNTYQFFGADAAGLIDPVVGDGYYVMLHPLAAGHYTLEFGARLGSPFDFEVKAIYKIKVKEVKFDRKRSGGASIEDQDALEVFPPPPNQAPAPSEKNILPQTLPVRLMTTTTGDASVAHRASATDPHSSLPAISRDPRRDFWVPDGRVFSIVEAQGTVFIGGDFNYVGPDAETGGAFDIYSGSPDPDFPKVNGAIRAVAIDPRGGWIVGGQFTSVGGVARANLARIHPDKTVDLAWQADTDGPVLTLLASADWVYAGGSFTVVGNQVRNRAAALALDTGAVTPWNPDVQTSVKRCSVRTLVLSADKVYVGGSFNSIDGQDRENIASVDAVTGRVTDWQPLRLFGTEALNTINTIAAVDGTVYVGGSFGSLFSASRHNLAAFSASGTTNVLREWNPGANGPIYAMAVSCNIGYVAGSFTSIGGMPRHNLAAVDLQSGRVLDWNPEADGLVRSLLLSGNTLYAGGQFASISGMPHEHLAALDVTTGKPRTWHPKADFDISAMAVSAEAVFAGGTVSPGGLRRQNVAALDARTGKLLDWNPGANGPIHALAVSGESLYLGGDFTDVSGQFRRHLAAVGTRTGAILPWNPDVNGLVKPYSVIKCLAVSGTTVFAGGSFTNVGQHTRHRLAAIDGASGQVLPWNPSANDDVYALLAVGNTVFAGGRFTGIGGTPRRRFAALDAVTGADLNWNVEPNDAVRSIALAQDTLYLGGGFTRIAGQPRNTLAAVDASSGQVSSWDARLSNTNTVNSLPLNTYVYAVATRNSHVMAGGYFNQLGDRSFNNLGAVPFADSTAIETWDPQPDSIIHALAAVSGAVYAGGSFQTMGGEYQPGLAVFPPVGSPRITSHPRHQRVYAGQSVSFSVDASGVEPLSYQWQLDGKDIPGAHEPFYTIAGAGTSHAGQYAVVVTNALGLINSRSVALTVLQPLYIVSQPASQSVSPGATVTLSVTIEGSPPPIYQWRLNGENIPGAVFPTLILENVQPTDGGSYQAVAANLAGALTSDIATVLVSSPALPFSDFIETRGLIAGTSGAGSGNNFAATKLDPGEPNHAGRMGGRSVWLEWTAPATGIARFSTRGSSFDTLLAVYTNASNLGLIAQDDDRAGFYTSQVEFNATADIKYLLALDGFSAASGNLVLSWDLDTSALPFPRILTEPSSLTVVQGQSASFSVTVLSTTPVSYQWFLGCRAIPGATSSNLNINATSSADVGIYHVAVMNASSRAAISEDAALEIGPNALVQSQDKIEDPITQTSSLPASLQGEGGGSGGLFTTPFVSVSVGSSDTQLFDTTLARTGLGEPNHCEVLGGASKSFDLGPQADAVFILDTVGSKFDTVLAVYNRVGLLSLATNMVACDNNSAPDGIRSRVRFGVTGGRVYRAYVDGVGGAAGEVQLNWKLGLPPPGATKPPASRTVRLGKPSSLAAEVERSTRWQWTLNGTRLLGETNEVLLLDGSTAAAGGLYGVIASNEFGDISKDVAMVTVEIPWLQLEPRWSEGLVRVCVTDQWNGILVVEKAVQADAAPSQWLPLFIHPPLAAPRCVEFRLDEAGQTFIRARPGP